MSISRYMAEFTLANTGDPVVAGSCVDLLSASVFERVAPKTHFSPAWVLAQSDGAKLAYGVRYCDDPVVLGEVCRRDQRKAVRMALAQNKYLPDEAKAVLAKDEVLGLAIAEAGDDLDERLTWLLKFISPRKHYVHLDRAGLVTLLAEHASELPSGPDTAIVGLAKSRFYTYMVNEYLRTVYALQHSEKYPIRYAGKYRLTQREREVWSRVSLSPAQVLDLINPYALKKVLSQFAVDLAQELKVTKEPLALSIDAEVTKLLLKHAVPPKVVDPRRVHDLFSPAAVDLLIADTKWRRLLLHQSLTDEQFSSLVQATPTRWRIDLFAGLNGSRGRLGVLSNAMAASRALITKENLANALACVEGSDDTILDWLVGRVDPEYDISNYLLGGWHSAPGRSNILRPPAEKVLRVVTCFKPSATSGLGKGHVSVSEFSTYLVEALSTVSGADEMPQWVLEALVDNVEGLAYSARSAPRVGAYIFDCFGEIDVPLEQALAQFEMYGSNTTFAKICKTLRALALSSRA